MYKRQVEDTLTDKVLNVNEWHHIAGVYTGTTLQIYLDGEMILENVDGSRNGMNATDTNFWIGYDPVGGDVYKRQLIYNAFQRFYRLSPVGII